jgi:hypothetical protein
LLYDEWVIEEIREEIKKFLELNENEITETMGQEKPVLRGKFIAMSEYIKNTERSQINHLILLLKLLEKQEQVKPKISTRKEIMERKG